MTLSTPEQAESAFYRAFERADLAAMMAVWAEDEEIVCVHPAGERLTGQDQVRTSWAKIFAGGARVRVHISQQVAISGMMIEVHSVQENFSVEGGRQSSDLRPAPVVATNVYL